MWARIYSGSIREKVDDMYTNKQLGGYRKAMRNGISMNDAFNMQSFGITQQQFGVMRKVENDIHGMSGSYLTLSELNAHNYIRRALA